MSDMVEIKIVPKSTELKIRTKMVSSLMVIISAKNLSEEIFPDLASAIISANQGHVANFSVLKNERRPDTFRVIQSKMEISAQEDFKIATNFKMILKVSIDLREILDFTISKKLIQCIFFISRKKRSGFVKKDDLVGQSFQVVTILKILPCL